MLVKTIGLVAVIGLAVAPIFIAYQCNSFGACYAFTLLLQAVLVLFLVLFTKRCFRQHGHRWTTWEKKYL